MSPRGKTPDGRRYRVVRPPPPSAQLEAFYLTRNIEPRPSTEERYIVPRVVRPSGVAEPNGVDL